MPVSVLPGPSAVLTALALSGLPVDRFCFEGFLPRKAGERATRLRGTGVEPRTMVFFEAPHRIAEMLRAMARRWVGSSCRGVPRADEDVRGGATRNARRARGVERVRACAAR